jgi:hypothetical protein
MPIGDSFGQIQGFRNAIAAQNSSNYFNALASDRADAGMEESFLANDRRDALLHRQMLADAERNDYFRDLNERQFAAQREDAAFSRDYSTAALRQQREEKNAILQDKKGRENEALFGSLYNEILKGNIADIPTLAAIEDGRLDGDQFAALRTVLGNLQTKSAKSYFHGAAATAGQLNEQAESDPKMRVSKAAVAPIRDEYFNTFGVYPEEDPHIEDVADYADSMFPKGSKYFGWVPGVTSTGQADKARESFTKELDRRDAYFNEFATKAVKGRAGNDIIADPSFKTFRPRQAAPEQLDALSYASNPEAKNYFKPTATTTSSSGAKPKTPPTQGDAFNSEAEARAAGFDTGDVVRIVANGRILKVKLK